MKKTFMKCRLLAVFFIFVLLYENLLFGKEEGEGRVRSGKWESLI